MQGVISSRQEDLDIFKLIPTQEYLMELASKKAVEYRTALPYPHICMDNFLPENVAEDVLEAFPTPQGISWQEFRNDREKKLANGDDRVFPPVVRNVLAALNSATFLTFLEKLTGIEGLIADPYFNGGGLHQILPGGKLGLHIDFNRHGRLKLERRLNLLIYLNKDWEDSYGGHFELWTRDGKSCVKKILPIFNRCVVFTTSEDSWHGHPHPLTCPPDRSRKSLALYYYTSDRDDESKAAPTHSTVFVDIPEDKKLSNRLSRSLKGAIRAVTPPIVYNLFKGEK